MNNYDTKVINSYNLCDQDMDEVTVRSRGIIINSFNEILMCYSNGLKHYEFPGGHLEKNESINEGLIRELKEECGLDISNDIINPLFCIKYYCKNYKGTKKNRLVSIYYSEIITDEKFCLENRNLDENEVQQNYECRYVDVDSLEFILKMNMLTTKEKNTSLEDMLYVFDKYKNNLSGCKHGRL